MKLKQTLTAMAALGLIAAGAAHADLTAKDYGKQAFGEFNGNPGDGPEFALPSLTFADTNADGYPDKVTVKVKVYPTNGSTVAKSTTVAKAIATPVLPTGCTAGTLEYETVLSRQAYHLDSTAAVQAGSTRLMLGINMKGTCTAGATGSTNASGVYNAELSSTTVGWSVAYKGQTIDTLGGGSMGGFMGGDPLNDDIAMVGVKTPVSTGWNLTGYIYDPATGTQAMKAAYIIAR